MAERLLSYEELAKTMGVSTRTLRKWVAEGYIPFKKIGPMQNGTVRFVYSDVLAAITPKVVSNEC